MATRRRARHDDHAMALPGEEPSGAPGQILRQVLAEAEPREEFGLWLDVESLLPVIGATETTEGLRQL